jgi:hypothetical protein
VIDDRHRTATARPQQPSKTIAYGIAPHGGSDISLISGHQTAAVNSLVEGCDLAAVTLAFEGGGSERDTVLLCNALAEKSVRVAILVLHIQGVLRSLLDSTIRVITVLGRRLRSHWSVDMSARKGRSCFRAMIPIL